MPIIIGSRFDRYEILSLLGAGGMGEVYLALDSKLDRKVALKILPPLYTNDSERVRRFEKEARAVSALNHPNIITIYEVGETENAHFIATEYIEGLTLRKRMRKERLTIAEALDIAIQVAGALNAAHSAGILHRDIKPENIMLRPDGYVKVLDFGLAKLTERRDDSESGGRSPLEIETEPGMVLGTATYMSPEQARAQKLDERTDIFSLGIVLYEMIAGRSPFYDQTTSDVMAAILHREPIPLSQQSPEVTPELEAIVCQALSKDRDARYKTAKDLQTELRNLRQENAFQSSPSRSSKDENLRPTGDRGAGKIDQQDFETSLEPMARVTGAAASNDTTSARIIIGEIKKHKRGLILGLFGFVLIVVALGFGIVQWMSSQSVSPAFKNAKFTRLPISGRAVDAVISPDGKYIAYVVDDGGKRSLWVKQATANSATLQVVPPTELRFRSPTFSRDGNHIFYVLRRLDAPAGDLYRIPALGGVPRKLLAGVSSPVALSPDDGKLVYIREIPAEGVSVMLIANSNGTNERELIRRSLPDSFSIEGPDWSPDGRLIACSTARFDNGVHHNLVVLRADNGSGKALLEQSWPTVGRVVWTADGNGILMAARENSALGRQIWFVNYYDGKVSRITNDLNDYRGVTASSDGSTIAAVQINQISNLWVTPSHDSSLARQITFGSASNDGAQGIAWTPDGKIIYSSNASGKPDLWRINADGNQLQQLTADVGNNGFPAVTADGRYIVFNSDRSGSGGNVGVWRVDSDGGNPRQLTSGQLDIDPHPLPTNDWVVFSSINSGKRTLWKVPIDGGRAVQIIDALSEYPVASPDGKWLACSYRDEKNMAAARLAVIPINGGSPVKTFDIAVSPGRLVRWAPDSSALTYVTFNNGVGNLWSLPLTGGAPKQITDFRSNQIFGFDWSPDGKWLALARGLETREIVLISNYR